MPVGVLDLDGLTKRLLPHLGACQSAPGVSRLEKLTGGMSGLTYLVHLSDSTNKPIVLKIATPGVPPVRNRDVLRQAAILCHVGGTQRVPVARVLFQDAGAPPDIPPFFAVEFVPGESVEPLEESDGVPPNKGELASRYEDAAAVLGQLHSIGVSASDFPTEPRNGPTEELAKWEQVFDAVPEELRFEAATCAALLRNSIPGDVPPALLHGDFRLGNMLCVGGSVAAVIDWEIWAIGDPRSDLAWFLNSANAHGPMAQRHDLPVPSREELLATYRQAGAGSISDIEWFEALMLYKRAAASALIVKHNRRSVILDEKRESMVLCISPLLAEAAEIIARRRRWDS